MFVVVLLATTLTVIFAYYKWIYQYWERKNLPYLKPSIPYGNITSPLRRKENFGITIHKIYNEMKQRKWKHGGIYTVTSPDYVVVDLDYVRNIMSKDFQYFVDRGFYYNEEKDPLSAHLFALGGPKWRTLRTKLTPTFTSGKMKMMFQTLLDCEKNLQKKMLVEYEKKQPVDIKEILSCFTTDIIGSCAFGLECNTFEEENSPFRVYGKKVFLASPFRALKTTFALAFPEFSKSLGLTLTPKDIQEFFMKVVKDTVNYREKNNYSRKDFMQLLIDMKNNKLAEDEGYKHDGNSLTIEEIAAQCFVFFLAGFETSSTTMTFALYELAKHQSLQDKVREEIKSVLGKYDGQITYEAIQDMKYMNQVIDGHQDVCEALLEAGARIDETDNEGKAPLALAAQGGHAALASMFLDKYNAPIDQRPHDGKTALRLAALEGHYEVVLLLAGHSAGIDSKDADGRSTLYVLALDNRLAMSKYFIQQGADVETRDLEGRTPLHVSSWQGHTEMVSLLLTYGKCQVDACDLENRTALHSASWQGHSDIVKLLLEHGALADHTCNQGATALGIAAQEGHELCVVALLEHGADPNHSDACGRNALRVAAKSGHRGVVRLLEEYNARSHKTAHTSSSANSITSASTAETKPSCAVLYPGNSDWCEQQRRSMVSLGNHSSNSKSSSNLTGSSHSSRHGDRQRENTQNTQPMSFTQQLQQCSRGGKTRPLSKLLSPLQSEPQSPIYASPPLSPVHDTPNMFGAMNIYQPVLRHNNFAKAPDTHFARDTHMRIILGNSSAVGVGKDKKSEQGQESNSKSSQKPKRNGIVTNPALRLVANVKNGLDTAAANLRKSTSGANPSTKTNSFHWRKETPL